MRKNSVWGMLGAVVLMAAAGDAYAANQIVDCTGAPGALAAQFTGATFGGTPGTTYLFTGPCTGNFLIGARGITIEPNGAVNNTINGEVQIGAASGIFLMNVTIDGSTNTPDAAVVVQGPALVQISGSTIQNSLQHGINAAGPAEVDITSTTVTNSAKIGVRANHSAIIRMSNDTVTGNQQGGVSADHSSTITVKGGTIDQSSAPNGIAVLAFQGSSVDMEGVSVTGPTGNRTITAIQSGSVGLQGSTVTADTLPVNAQIPFAVITAVGSSSVVLAGGNTISNTASGGVAVLVGDGSSLIESNGTLFGLPAALDTISGNGRIQTQSAIELAFSPNGGGVDWTGNILVAQASSFRSDGNNVTINGTLTLGSAANGYFNQSTWSGSGSSNSITSVVCQSMTDHVTNPNLVSPPITIAAPPGCQLF